MGDQGVCCAYLLKTNASDPERWQLVCNKDIQRVSMAWMTGGVGRCHMMMQLAGSGFSAPAMSLILAISCTMPGNSLGWLVG